MMKLLNDKLLCKNDYTMHARCIQYFSIKKIKKMQLNVLIPANFAERFNYSR